MAATRGIPEICPFLAAARDPDSVLNYPTTQNRCHKLSDPHEITEEHQAEYCLRARHWFCPVYTGAVKRPSFPIQFETVLPIEQQIEPRFEPRDEKPEPGVRREIRSGRGRSGVTRWAFGAGVVVVIGAALWAASGLPNRFGGLVTTATATLTMIPNPTETLVPTPTGLPSETATVTATPTFTDTATASPSVTASPTATVTATPKACQIPADWGKYSVLAGETYFKIAARYGTTVEALQRVNCLPNPGVLYTGQVISVPPAPTVTPTANATSAPAAFASENVPTQKPN